MSHATTAADFAAFEAVARDWLRRFGLMDWEVQFEHVPCDGNRAEAHYDANSRRASLVLSRTWGDAIVTAEAIATSALHEVAHILLADLTSHGNRRWINMYDLERLEEACVMRITAALGPMLRADLPVRVPRRRLLKANGQDQAEVTAA